MIVHVRAADGMPLDVELTPRERQMRRHFDFELDHGAGLVEAYDETVRFFGWPEANPDLRWWLTGVKP